MASRPPSSPEDERETATAADGEASFRRDYSVALARALLESEEEQRRQPSDEEVAGEAYVALCHDDPVVTTRGCRVLAATLVAPRRSSRRGPGWMTAASAAVASVNPAAAAGGGERSAAPSLSSSSSSYALSDRLVEGIRQATDRVSSIGRDCGGGDDALPRNAEQRQLSEGEGQRGDANGDGDGSEESACALLAWTVYGRIPLLCCLSDRLEEARLYIGSYRPGEGQDDEEEMNVSDVDSRAERSEAAVDREEDDPAGQVQRRDLEDVNREGPADAAMMNGNGHLPVDDDLAEVWAEESDPSDFEYESGFDYSRQLADLDAWASQIDVDPVRLSESPAETGWDDVAGAVTRLLRECSFRRLSALSLYQWRQSRISDHLAQLVMTLLVQPSDDDGMSPLLRERTAEHWQRLGLQPLHLLRDAVLHHEANFLIQDYLQLLQTLIKVDDTQRQQRRGYAESEASAVAPATWVGLSALSALCSSLLDRDNQVPALRTAVLESSDDLAILLERAADGDAAPAIPWTYLSFFQVLGAAPQVRRAGSSPAAAASACRSLSNPQAQTLLNSGLFRQWLVWWHRTAEGDLAVERPMRQSLFSLCLRCPTLLGKYAWRTPGLAARVTTAVGAGEENPSLLVDALFWNLLGSRLASQSSSASPVVRWKDGRSDAVNGPPTPAACQQAAGTLFERLCRNLADVLEDWKRRRRGDLPASNDLLSQQTVAAEFVRVIKELSSEPLLLCLFRDHVAKKSSQRDAIDGTPGPGDPLPALLRPIEQVLVQWPSLSSSSPSRSSSGPGPGDEHLSDDDEDDDPSAIGGRPQRRRAGPFRGGEDEAVGVVRKSIKDLKLSLEEDDAAGDPGDTVHRQGGVRLNPRPLSSKTD